MVMAFAMGVTVYAADITITNGAAGSEYAAYRLLNATDGGEGKLAYTLNDKYAAALKEVTGKTEDKDVINYISGLDADGIRAFADAVFFATKVENNGENSRKIGVSEIWYRLPKFILGFFAASLIASFIAVPAFGKETVSSINSVLDQYKNWAFVLAFTSIGLETNFREIKEQFQGGKPLTLYVVGQLFNIVLTFAAVYLLLSGKFFPLPNLAL